MSKSNVLFGSGHGGGASNMRGVSNTVMNDYSRAVSHWPAQNGGAPPGFGRTNYATPNTGTYYATLSAMWGGGMGSSAPHSVHATNVDMDVPSTAIFIGTNGHDGSLAMLREGHLMFAHADTTDSYRGSSYNLASVNALLLEAAWDNEGRPQSGLAPVGGVGTGAEYEQRVSVGSKRAGSSLFGGEQHADKERRQKYATTIDDAVAKWLPLGPLLGTMRDAHSDNTAFTYAVCGPAMLPQLALGLRIGDAVGIVYTEMDVPSSVRTVCDIKGVPIRDRAVPQRAVQVRFVNLSAHGVSPRDGSIEPFGYIGDVTRINPYDPVLGYQLQTLRAATVTSIDGKQYRVPRRALPYTQFLGYVKDLPTEGPTQEEVDAAHHDAAAYEALYATSRMKVVLVRRAGPAIDPDLVVREVDEVYNPPLFTAQWSANVQRAAAASAAAAGVSVQQQSIAATGE